MQEIMSLAELSKIWDKEKKERIKKGKWGAWYLSKNRQYFCINRSYVYDIPISQLKFDGPLHWLAHLREKAWLKRGDIEDLIKAFDDLFGYGWFYKGMDRKKVNWKLSELSSSLVEKIKKSSTKLLSKVEKKRFSRNANRTN